jgi:hypothetical protein
MDKFKRKFFELKSKIEETISSYDATQLENKLDETKKMISNYQKIINEKAIDPNLQDQISSYFSSSLSNLTNLGSKASASIFSFMSDIDLLRHLETITKSASTVYDKALDSEYLKSHIGGGDHRLFDGGHDIFGAWDKVKEALPNDSFQEEVLGYISAIWKDLSTVKGLPFQTVSKESFQNWVDAVSGWIPGVDRKYLYDLLSFDAYELLSSGLGVVSIIFALKREDQEKLAELLGSMGIVSILSANPIMGILVIGTSAFAYTKKKMEFDKKAFGKSAVLAGTSMALFSILGMPILFELVIVGILTNILKKQVLENDQLLANIKNQFTEKFLREKKTA